MEQRYQEYFLILCTTFWGPQEGAQKLNQFTDSSDSDSRFYHLTAQTTTTKGLSYTS